MPDTKNKTPSSHAANTAPDWMAVGAFAQPHGVSGRIKVKSFGESPDDFADHKTLTDERGNVVKLRITGHTQGMAIVEIEGVKSREEAELLRGRKIGISPDTLPGLSKPNTYYIHELVGLKVNTLGGELFGSVKQVMNFGAGDILEIARPDGETELFAFTHATFPTVDIKGGTITIDPPEVVVAGKPGKDGEA